MATVKGVSCRLKGGRGSTKKNQKSCTSRDVPRKTSTYTLPIQRTMRFGAARNAVATPAMTIASRMLMTAIWIVTSVPFNIRGRSSLRSLMTVPR